MKKKMKCADCPTCGFFILGCPTPVLALIMRDETWSCAFDKKDFKKIYTPEPLSGLGNAETSRTGIHG